MAGSLTRFLVASGDFICLHGMALALRSSYFPRSVYAEHGSWVTLERCNDRERYHGLPALYARVCF